MGIGEFFLEIYKTSKERLKNRYVGTFIISWVVINWQAVAILILSDLEITRRLEYIYIQYYDRYYLFWIPLTISVVYRVIAPGIFAILDFIAFIIEKPSLHGHYKRLNEVAEIKKKNSEIRLETAQNEAEIQELDQIKINNIALKKQLELLNNENDNQKKEIGNLKNRETGYQDVMELERLIEKVKSSKFGLHSKDSTTKGFQYYRRIFDSVLKSPHSNEQLKTMVNEKLRSDSIVLNDDLVMQAYDRIMSIEKENYEALKYFFENFKMIPSFNGRTLETESKSRIKYLEDKSIIYQANEIKTKDSMLRYKITDLGYHVKAMNDVLGMIKANPTNFRSMD
jgi:hypothetical protein